MFIGFHFLFLFFINLFVVVAAVIIVVAVAVVVVVVYNVHWVYLAVSSVCFRLLNTTVLPT